MVLITTGSDENNDSALDQAKSTTPAVKLLMSIFVLAKHKNNT